MIDREIDKTKLGVDLSWQTLRGDLFKALDKATKNLVGLPIENNIAQDRLAKKLNEYIETEKTRRNSDIENIDMLLDDSFYCHRCGSALRRNLIAGFFEECLCKKCNAQLENDHLLNRIKNRNRVEELRKADRVVRGLMG